MNPYLGWEEKKEWNIGVDYSFFGNRMYGKFDYYRRKIDGMIYEVNVPQPPYPNGKQWQNIGEMESKGWEFEVGGDIIQNKDFTWTSSLNMSHNSGKILTMYGNNSRMDGNAMDEPGWPGDAARIEEGQRSVRSICGNSLDSTIKETSFCTIRMVRLYLLPRRV